MKWNKWCKFDDDDNYDDDDGNNDDNLMRGEKKKHPRKSIDINRYKNSVLYEFTA